MPADPPPPNDPDESLDVRAGAERMSILGRVTKDLRHDLGNSFAAMTSFAGLVAADPSLSADVRRNATLLVREVEQLSRVVTGLLEFARPGRGPQRTTLAPVVDQVIDLLAPAAHRVHVELRAESEPAVPEVEADPEAIRLLVAALVLAAVDDAAANAIQDRIVVRLERSETGVRLAVDAPAPVGRSPDLPAVVEAIVRDLDGALRRERASGRHRTVVELPEHRGGLGRHNELPATHGSRTAEDVGTATTRPRVLVVDDEEAIRLFLARVLESAGWEVVHATDGADALERLERDPFDVVVCDHRMPRMSGPDLYEASVALQPALAGRFVLMSGDVADDQLAEFAATHGLRTLAKPFNVAAVTRTVRAVLEADASARG